VLTVVAALATAAGWAAEPPPAHEVSQIETAAAKPRVIGELPTRVRYRLELAFPVAVQRVREVESCRALFADLGADGLLKLERTIYLPPQPGEGRSCRSRVVAFTGVGTPHTRLCPAFGGLANDRAAIGLIHEALHFAGLGERPSDPHGMSPLQINTMVERACGL
jgi:hypothetical protein